MDDTIFADVVIALDKADKAYRQDINNESLYLKWYELHRLHSAMLVERQMSRISQVNYTV